MEYFSKTQTATTIPLKFGKSPSSSSMGTEAEMQQRNETIPRKISDEQKQRFINLITV